MSVDALKQYPVGVATSDIPQSWTSSNEPRVVSGGSRRIVSIASQNGTVTSGQQLSFQLPANMGAGFMVSGSAYVKMTVSVTQAAISYAFKHYGAASALISQASFLMGGAQVENIQQYNKLYAALANHATNFNFLANDDKIAQYTYNGAAITDGAVTVCVPVMLGSFNAHRDLPLFLTSANQLQLTLEQVDAAFTTIGAGGNVTAYTVSNATLVFEQCIPDSGYEAAIKQMMAQRLYQIPISTWINSRFAKASTLNQNLVLNTSSLKAVLWAHVQTNAARKWQQFYDGGQTSAQLFLDGALVSNSNLSSSSEQFLEMNRALNLMFDSSRTSVMPSNPDVGDADPADFVPVASGTRALYTGAAYLGGLACQRTREQGFSMSGTPVSSAVIQLIGNADAGETFVFCAVDQVVAIDASGAATLIR